METIIEEDLPMQVDCIQWHPTSDEIMAVGAYQLSPTTTDTRIGRLYVIQLTPNVPGGFSVVLEYETPGGVLDFKFSPYPTPTPHSPTPLALATSTGLYTFTLQITPTFTLTPLITMETTAMCLYLQWISPVSLIFSDGDGCINLLDTELTTETPMHLRKRKKLHEALTWICHYSNEQDVLYAGCDDGKFNAVKLENLSKEELHWVKKFEVGVTSIATREDIVSIGGYDDTLRLYKLSNTPKPTLTPLTSLNLQGAVWRTFILPSFHGNAWTFVVSTARKGIKFLEYDLDSKSLSLISEEMKYEGFLAYGLDVRIEDKRLKIASGYFDNNVIHAFYWG